MLLVNKSVLFENLLVMPKSYRRMLWVACLISVFMSIALIMGVPKGGDWVSSWVLDVFPIAKENIEGLHKYGFGERVNVIYSVFVCQIGLGICFLLYTIFSKKISAEMPGVFAGYYRGVIASWGERAWLHYFTMVLVWFLLFFVWPYFSLVIDFEATRFKSSNVSHISDASLVFYGLVMLFPFHGGAVFVLVLRCLKELWIK